MFSSIAQRIYQYLSLHGPCTLSEVLDALGLRIQELDDGLNELEKNNLLYRNPLDESYSATSPQVALATAVSREEEQIQTLRTYVAQQRRDFAELFAVYDTAANHSAGSSGLEIVDDPRRVRDLVFDYGRQASESIVDAHPGIWLSADMLQANLRSDKEILERGIQRKTIFDAVTSQHAPTVRCVRELSQIGVEIRVSTYIPARVVIYDEKAAIIGRHQSPSDNGAIFTTNTELIRILLRYYQAAWENARPFPGTEIPSDPGPNPSGMKVNVLRSLATGQSDEASARRLNVSVRTYRRHVAAIMRDLNAHTRFQAGVKATRMGWLE